MSSAEKPPALDRLERLGRGHNAVVYRVRLEKSGTEAALRMDRPGAMFDNPFRNRSRETLPESLHCWRTVGDLEHVVTVLGAGTRPRPWLLLELLPETLENCRENLSVQSRGRILARTASTLVAAHERGVAHFDIKPKNVLLDAQETPKLGDWGEAKWIDEQRIPDERVDRGLWNSARNRTKDVRQFGMMTYELLTGRGPYDPHSRLDIEEYFETVRIEPPSAIERDIPPALDQSVLETFAVESEARVDTLESLCTALQEGFDCSDGDSPLAIDE